MRRLKIAVLIQLVRITERLLEYFEKTLIKQIKPLEIDLEVSRPRCHIMRVGRDGIALEENVPFERLEENRKKN